MDNDVIQKGRLLYFEPVNEVGSRDNEVYRLEDYNIYVDLCVIIPTRDGGSLDKKISIINGVNGQLTDSFINASYSEIRGSNISNAENLGIESINIAIDSHMYPQVSIKFVDVRGFSLMMPSMMQNNKDSYNALFNAIFKFPYPRFELTVKGFYGTPVVYDLAVNEFTSGLNSSTGNYEMTVTFIGYPFGLLSDIPMNLIIAAPYIESDDKAELTSYWTDACSTRLKYTDKGGPSNPEVSGIELMTFIDYIKATNNINDKIKENGDADAIDNLNEASNEIDIISSFKAAYGELKKALSSISGYSEDNINHIYILPYQLRDENNNVGNKAAEIIKEKNFEQIWKRCPFNYIFENANNQIKVKNEEQLRSLTGSTSESKYFKENDKNSFKIICTEFENNLNSEESKTQDKVSKAQESLQEKLPDILKRALGFEPFVLNYFRMSYGHLDVFFHYFYEVINNIMSDKAGRIPSKLGLDYDNSDLSKKTDLKNGFVPPFPAVSDKEGKLVYPGSLSNLSDIEEVKLVEKILSAALKAKRKTNEYIIAAANKEETNGAAGTLGFVPSSIFDIFWGTKNPYTMVHNLREAYYLFVLRTMISRLTNEGGGDASSVRPQAIEAYNYYLSNPNPSEDIKAELKKVVNDMKATGTYDNDQNIIDVCDYLNLGVNVKGKEGNSKSYVEPIYCASDQKEKLPVYVYNPAFFYNSIYKQTAGNRLSINSSLSPTTITDFADYHPALYYVIDNSSTSSSLKASIEAMKSGISGAESQAEEVYTAKLSYSAKKASGDENTAIDISKNPFIKSMKSITDSIAQNITTEKGDDFYKFLENESLKENKIKESLCCYPTDIITDGKNSRPRRRWKMNSDPENMAGHIIEGEYLSKDILKTIDENIDTYAFPRNTGIVSGSMTINYLKDIKNPIDMAQAVILSTCIEQSRVADIFNSFSKSPKNTIQITPKIAVLCAGLCRSDKIENNVLRNSLSKYANEWAKSDECSKLFEIVKRVDKNNLYNATDGNVLLKFYFEPCYIFYGGHRSLGKAIIANQSEGLTEYSFSKALFNNFHSNLARLYGLVSQENDDKEKEAEKTAAEKEKELSSMLSDDYRLSIYLTLKKIYDKWCPSYDPKEFILPSPEDGYKKEVENMLNGPEEHEDNFFTDTIYVDSMFNRLGTELEVNPRTVYSIIMKQLEGGTNYSFLEFISQICQINKMMFFSVPMKIPYSAGEIRYIFTPEVLTSPAKRRNTYIAMYPHDVSHFVTNSESANWGFDDDGLDLQMVSKDNGPEELTNLFTKNDDSTFVYNVPTFAVTYAKQNQSFFNSISVNMDAPRITDFSIANVFELGNLTKYGGVSTPQTVAQDMYAIYSNRSYNCDVTMLGCMNIMPMMYFQLNNIPMFRGAYIITRVEHDIRNNHVSTRFMGTRVSKYLMPYNKDVFNFTLFKDFFGVRMATAVPQDGNGSAVSGGIGYTGLTNISINIDEKIRKNQKIKDGKTPPEELSNAINAASGTYGIPKIYFYMMSYLESSWRNANANDSGYGGYFGTKDLSINGGIKKSVELYKEAEKRNSRWGFTGDAFLVYAYMVHNSGPAGADYQLSLTQGKIESITTETTMAYANHFFPKLSSSKKDSVAAEKYAAPKKAFYVIQQLKDGRFNNLIN